MPAQADRGFALVATYSLAEDLVFDKETENHEVEVGILGGSRGEVGVLEEIRSQGDEAGECLFFSLFWGQGDEIEAKQLVCVGEIICGQ